MESSLHDEVLQIPVTAEALTSLRSLVEQDADALDDMSKGCLQTMASAAHVSFAGRPLLQDENELLFKIKYISIGAYRHANIRH
jgi:hypothetical protein